MNDELREAIARWLWAMDTKPGAVWDERPDEHAEYLSKADDFAAGLPWLAALRAKADAADWVRELAEEWEGESVSAMKRADVARERDDRVLYTTNLRHARVIHQAATALLAALDGDES